MTADAVPRFHRLGRGIAPDTAFGRLLARLSSGEIGEGDLPLSVTEAVPARFRAAKEAWCGAGAQVAHAVAARR